MNVLGLTRPVRAGLDLTITGTSRLGERECARKAEGERLSKEDMKQDIKLSRDVEINRERERERQRERERDRDRQTD